MNEMRSPEGEAMWGKATEIAEFLADILNKDPEEVNALFEQIGIKEDSDESKWLSLAMDQENYIAMSQEKRDRIDDMYQSLKSAVEGEANAE